MSQNLTKICQKAVKKTLKNHKALEGFTPLKKSKSSSFKTMNNEMYKQWCFSVEVDLLIVQGFVWTTRNQLNQSETHQLHSVDSRHSFVFGEKLQPPWLRFYILMLNRELLSTSFLTLLFAKCLAVCIEQPCDGKNLSWHL